MTALDDLLFDGDELALRRYLLPPRQDEVLAELVRRVVARCAEACREQAAEEPDPAAQMACLACADRVRGIPL